ncbi:MAG: NAD(P)/FAD-dependent oxidoreductase [Mycolicibacterium cosmeticum]|nr:NAD(P)/FAD-dependent oxidoreductase [Mycolicibacterium cosmeticum]
MNAGLIIIGSGPAGVSAAAAFREHNTELPVQILTEDPDQPYARPPLSKEYLRNDTDDVQLHDPGWYTDRDIEVLHTGPIDRIDPAAKIVAAGDRIFGYGALVLASGSEPKPLPVPGGETAMQLRSLSDAARLRTASSESESAVVIGAGFIGCEAAASLAMRGVSTTLVAPDEAPQTKRLGSDVGARLRVLLERVGVRYLGSVSVTSIRDGAVRLDNGASIESDLILAATGVTPRSGLAVDAGLETDGGRVVVGAGMRTAAAAIYAAGDVALALNAGAGRRLPVEHWQDADDQGAVAGENAAGGSREWDAVPGFWTTIGEATVKYHAWGDGYDHSRFLDRGDGFTVWYESNGVAVGVLTHNSDDDYELGEEVIAARKPAPKEH